LRHDKQSVNLVQNAISTNQIPVADSVDKRHTSEIILHFHAPLPLQATEEADIIHQLKFGSIAQKNMTRSQLSDRCTYKSCMH
jgi:hypothetical protein